MKNNGLEIVCAFKVPGKPHGYYAQGKIPNWSRMQVYHNYKKHVQRCARKAGLGLPLRATRDDPLWIFVESVFPDGRHCDPGNVQKGICDALFYRGSGDKFTGGSFEPPQYNQDNPGAVVTVWRKKPDYAEIDFDMDQIMWDKEFNK